MRRSPSTWYRSSLVLLAAVALTVPGMPGQPVPLQDAPKNAPQFSEGFGLRLRMQEIDTTLLVGYAVHIADVNGDGKSDIVVVDTHQVYWYENPTWQRRTIIQGQTKPDNVCIASADIDGDGQLDFALGAGWRPFDTKVPGTLQWLKRGPTLDELWTVHPIPCDEPTIHRIRFADLDGDGKPELVVAPLMGRDSTRAGGWIDGRPVRLLAYKVPADPVGEPWTATVLDESLHIVHNFAPIRAEGRQGDDLLTASYEGVSLLSPANGRWNLRRLWPLESETRPSTTTGPRGAGEIKPGRLREGLKFIGTVEPYHGNQVVVYTASNDPKRPWQRHEVDTQLRWGHAVWCADLDGDGSDELIVGVRDDPLLTDEFKDRRGVRVYKARESDGRKWDRMLVDPGGVAVEDLTAADLNGNGHIDIIAVGRATGNLRIYWNEK